MISNVARYSESLTTGMAIPEEKVSEKTEHSKET